MKTALSAAAAAPSSLFHTACCSRDRLPSPSPRSSPSPSPSRHIPSHTQVLRSTRGRSAPRAGDAAHSFSTCPPLQLSGPQKTSLAWAFQAFTQTKSNYFLDIYTHSCVFAPRDYLRIVRRPAARHMAQGGKPEPLAKSAAVSKHYIIHMCERECIFYEPPPSRQYP